VIPAKRLYRSETPIGCRLEGGGKEPSIRCGPGYPIGRGQFKGDILGHARICRTELENVAVFIAAADRALCLVHALLISSAVLSSLLSLPAQYAEQGLCNVTVSVRPSVCLSQHGPTAANPPLQVCCCGPGGQAMWIDCCSSSLRRASATLSVYVDIAENRLVLCVIFFIYYETRRVVQISAHAKLMYTSDNKRESTLLRVQIPAKAKFAPTCVRNSLLSELS